ncbi:sugar kinase [Halobacteriales archaeon SW_7_68_16]|nr:MAG: sugar kinase [Halobacteriales archaeon SW_7_68_16]
MSSTRAFVPGHVSGFLVPHHDDDPTAAGSQGAGVTLTDGVAVAVSPADETTVVIDGEDVEMAAVERTLSALSVRGRVEVETDLPVGAGFGVSGAAALGAALAANAAVGLDLSRNELATVAHGAEVQAGTGLGDVAAMVAGGIPIRLEPGGPNENLIDAVPARCRVEYRSFGGRDTEAVLAGDTGAIERAGERALSIVVSEPTVDGLMRASRQFSREADLLTDRVRTAIREVGEVDGTAAMAMFGETVFALGTGLTDAGYEATVCEPSPGGASLK